jgi:iron complex outermembrane receptor protein
MQRFTALLFVLVSVPAAAQENAVKSAVDAFGERTGIEQVGLYSESEVRGFSLANSGAYRIEGAYFSQASPLDDTILSGVGVRVGVNATRLAYPSPSGVVNYRLRDAGPRDQFRLGAGLRDFGTRFLSGDITLHPRPFSIAGGFLWRPDNRYAQGYRGRAINAGLVGAWDIAPGQRLRAFGSLNSRSYNGDYDIAPTEAAVPPNLRTLHQYSPPWARTAATNLNFGLLYDGRIGGFTVNLAAFRSIWDIKHYDYTLLFAGRDGEASATTFRGPRNVKRAGSVEARVGREFKTGEFAHSLSLSARAGRTNTDLVSDLLIALGRFNLKTGDPPAPAEPTWTGTRGQDEARQATASAGYGLAWRDHVQLNFGIHRTRYDKKVLSIAGMETERVLRKNFYNASAVVSLTKRTAIFGSWVTGLEETGTAPGNATNRNEVLPPVRARELELGFRYSLKPQLTFIGVLFDVSKPTQGFRADGSYGEVGQVRHRGIEASIAGQLDPRTNVVVGVMAFQPRVSGPLVTAGLIGSKDAGVSHLVANANLERQLGSGWSMDASISYQGERWVDTANSFKAPAFTTVNLGARRRFSLVGRAGEIRVLASNIFGVEGYTAASSSLLSPIPPRTVRAILSLTFE